MENTTFDFTKAMKKPHAESMKNQGYSIVINVPPDSEYRKELDEFYLSDDELQDLKYLVAKEEARREEARNKKEALVS
jgi:hypothetical protein